MLKRLSCFALALSLLFGCERQPAHYPTPPEKVGAGEYVLPLIETSDIHGYVVYSENGTTHYRLAYIAANVDRMRPAGKDRALLLDGGDLYQGASVSNLLSGWPVYTSLDVMGYDAVALGNHEFDWGIETTVDQEDATLPDYEWQGKTVSNKVPVLCANLYQDGSRVSFTRDYTIVEKYAADASGNTVPVRIGIIGFAVNYSGSIMTSKFKGRGFSIKEDYSMANSIAGELERSGKCDATILLIHGAAEEVAPKLGQGTAIDLVLGGHSHRTVFGTTGWGLPYLQGGRYGEHFATASLRFKVGEDGSVSFLKADNLSILTVNSSRDTGAYPQELSAQIREISDAALEATRAAQEEVLGYITTSATSYYIGGSGDRAAVISNWMCDILRRIGEADVSFVNAGGIRTYFSLGGSSRRDITVANVYEMFPFGNTTYVYDLSYEDLLKVFEYSLTSGGSGLFSRMTGLDCRFSKNSSGSYSLHSLVKDGITIWNSGTWASGWASKRVRLAVSEYLATTERTDYYTGLPNPLIEWNGTPRLIASDLVDNDNAVRVLRAEASASGGLLSIDPAAHYILVSQ